MRWALVFSGQGAQHAAMLPWLARDAHVQALEATLGTDWRARLADPQLAFDNRRSQVLLTATACAAWAQLRPLLGAPAVIAGYSVGEMAAFAAAGVFDAQTAIVLAGRRAACMDDAAAHSQTGLMGVSGMPASGAEELCARFDLDVSIRIDAGSVVLGGPRDRLDDAAAEAGARGWHCTPLNVAMASHTRWMRGAAEAFERILAGVECHRPTLPLCSNLLGSTVRDGETARRALAGQIAQTVRWDQCMDRIAAHGVSAVLEIGPGQALARMWRERHEDIPARSADEFRHAAAIAAWLARQSG